VPLMSVGAKDDVTFAESLVSLPTVPLGMVAFDGESIVSSSVGCDPMAKEEELGATGAVVSSGEGAFGCGSLAELGAAAVPSGEGTAGCGLLTDESLGLSSGVVLSMLMDPTPKNRS